MRCAVLLCFLTVAEHPRAAHGAGIPQDLIKAVPAETVAAVFFAAPPTQQATGDARAALGLAAILLDQAQGVGLFAGLDDTLRAWLDVLAAAPAVLRFPTALALIDIRAVGRRDGGHRLAHLSAALIVRSRGDNTAIEGRIQRLLSTHTSTDHSTLSSRLVGKRDTRVLVDRRLDDWAELAWARVGDFYVIAIGKSALEKVIHTIDDPAVSLADDPWFARGWMRCGGSDASSAYFVRLREVIGASDESFAAKARRVSDNLGLAGVERALWCLGRSDRAVEFTRFERYRGEDRLVPISSARFLTGDHAGVVPPAATSFAAFDIAPKILVSRLTEAYIASQSPRAGAETRACWDALEADSGVSIRNDILDRLRGPVIIHDYPQHALRFPLARTILFPIDREPAKVRAAVWKLLDHADTYLRETGALRIERADDDIRYLSLGIAGPAITVTDEWVVISFSPTAVRQNLAHLHGQEKQVDSKFGKTDANAAPRSPQRKR